jgi:hypothetical protein
VISSIRTMADQDDLMQSVLNDDACRRRAASRRRTTEALDQSPDPHLPIIDNQEVGDRQNALTVASLAADRERPCPEILEQPGKDGLAPPALGSVVAHGG